MKKTVTVFFLVLLAAATLTTLLHTPEATLTTLLHTPEVHAPSNTRVFTSLTYDGYCTRIASDYETAHNDPTADICDYTGEYLYMGQGPSSIDRSYLYFDTSILLYFQTTLTLQVWF